MIRDYLFSDLIGFKLNVLYLYQIVSNLKENSYKEYSFNENNKVLKINRIKRLRMCFMYLLYALFVWFCCQHEQYIDMSTCIRFFISQSLCSGQMDDIPI